jgi:hypothetical protein
VHVFVELHNLLIGRWFRYAVLKGYEPRCEGRVLTGSEALRVIEDLLRDRAPHQVRDLYARHSGYIDMRRVSNDEVRRWFSYELAGSVHHGGNPRLVLVEVPMFGRLQPRGQTSSARTGAAGEAERLVSALDVLPSRGELVHDGDHYRLAIVARAAQMPGRDSYEALSSSEAQRLLQAMAANTRLPESVRDVLTKAVALLASAPSEGAQGQLVLLRRFRATGASTERAEPPITPAQFAKARQPKERTYIIVEVYSEDDAPIPGIALELVAPDGSVKKASTDENGETGLWDLDPASYSVNLA